MGPQCIGTEITDIAKLQGLNEVVTLKGRYRLENPDMSNRELGEFVMNNGSVDKSEQQLCYYKNYIEEMGLGDGKKLSYWLTFYGDVNVRLEGFSFRKRVKIRLRKMLNEIHELNQEYKDSEIDEDEHAVEMRLLSTAIPKHTGLLSERVTIYQVAKMLEIDVSVEQQPELWVVSPKQAVKKPKSDLHGSKRQIVCNWLQLVPLYEPTPIPDNIRDEVADTHIRTIISDSQYYCSYRRGAVTKFRGVLRDGELYVDGKFIAKCSSYPLLKMALAPMSLEPKHILNPRASRIGNDSSCETLA